MKWTLLLDQFSSLDLWIQRSVLFSVMGLCRDGISESQFSVVGAKELEAIRQVGRRGTAVTFHAFAELV